MNVYIVNTKSASSGYIIIIAKDKDDASDKAVKLLARACAVVGEEVYIPLDHDIIRFRGIDCRDLTLKDLDL